MKQGQTGALRYKIILLPFFTVILMFCADLYITKTFVPDYLQEGFMDQLELNVQNTKTDLDLYLHGFRKSAAELAKLPLISDARIDLAERLHRIVEASITSDEIAIYDRQGRVVIRYPDIDHMNEDRIIHSKAFRDAQASGSVQLSYTEHLHGDGNQHIAIVAYAPIPGSPEGEPSEVMEILMNLEEQDERNFVNQLIGGRELGFGGFSFVANRDGKILSHPDPSRIGTMIQDRIWTHITTQSESGSSGVITDTHVNESGFLIAYTRLDSLNWYLVAQVPLDHLTQGGERLWTEILPYYALIAAVMLVFAILLARRLTRPLLQLERSMNRVIEGDFKQKIEVSYQHDLGPVVAAFNRMIDLITSHNRELELKAFYDPLTSLYNHRMFQEVLEREFAAAVKRKQPLALMFLDIDRFKSVNDILGHQAGDRVLAEIAKLLVEHVRPNDIVARYGGEELVILCPNTDSATGKRIADRLCEAVRSHPFEEGKVQENGRITVSIGVADIQSAESKEVLIRHADEAMYMAKESGRNRAVVFSRAKHEET